VLKTNAKATPITPTVEPTERSMSLLAMTKVMPTAMTPKRAVSRSKACRASVVPKKAGLRTAPTM
jgi:hypothetical protein